MSAAAPHDRRQANRELRRLQLIEATIASINERGLMDATISQIAAAAGFTGANLYRYFGDKEGLLEATMRHIVELGQAEQRRLLALAEGPRERFLALVGAALAPTVFRVETCRAWLHFLAQAPHMASLARLERLSARLLRRSLSRAAADLLPPAAALRLADETVALLEGLRVQRAQVDEGFTPEDALTLVRSVVLDRLRQLAAGPQPAGD